MAAGDAIVATRMDETPKTTAELLRKIEELHRRNEVLEALEAERRQVVAALADRERRSNGRRGSGRGLFICKGIIEQHGGRIWAASSRGGGTTFHFTLPRDRSQIVSQGGGE